MTFKRKVTILFMLMVALAVIAVVVIIWPRAHKHAGVQHAVAAMPMSKSRVSHHARPNGTETPRATVTPSSANSTTIPPEGTPWAHLYVQLHDRAHAGDRYAASRLYRDAIRCRRYFRVTQSAGAALRDSTVTNEMSSERAETWSHDLRAMEKNLDSAASICAGVSEGELLKRFNAVLLDAASAGDESAAFCFVKTVFPPTSVDEPDATIARARHQQTSLRLIQSGIRSGDWRMVELMTWLSRDKHGLPTTGTPKGLVEPEPSNVFGLLWLQYLGAQAAHKQSVVDQLSEQLADLAERNGLSPSEQKQAEKWASGMYADYFQDSPYFKDDGMPMCDISTPEM